MAESAQWAETKVDGGKRKPLFETRAAEAQSRRAAPWSGFGQVLSTMRHCAVLEDIDDVAEPVVLDTARGP